MKFIFSLLVAVIVGSLSCSAADLDSSEYYSLSPVQSLTPTVNSALDYAVQPLAATSWDTSDQAHLAAIRNALTYATTLGDGSIFGWVQLIGQSFKEGVFDDILTEIEDISSGVVGNSYSILWYASEIYNDTSKLSDIYLSTSSSARSLEEINDAIQNDYDSLKELLKSIWGDTEDILSGVNSISSDLVSFSSLFTTNHPFQFYDYSSSSWVEFGGHWDFFEHIIRMDASLFFDGRDPYFGMPTLYRRIKLTQEAVEQLQKVLASDDDLALANSQKANREEIEDSFLNGSSGSTSLGASDFGDLADVGGTLKDSLSLDGNATIGSFTSGLAAADSSGQGWFSEATRAELDVVSSSVSTYSLRGDSDPYNMSGWEDRYYWLLGDDE